MAKKRKGRQLEIYNIPNDIIGRAAIDTRRGVMIQITPTEMINQMRLADKALNVPSNEAGRNALYELREWLSDVFESQDRRTKPKKS